MTADAEQEILALEQAALERWGRGDPSGFLEICDADVVYFDPFLPHRLDGLDALTRYYEGLRGKIQFVRFELGDARVQLLGELGEAAVLSCNYVSWGPSGAADRWSCTEVYRRTAAGWRIVATHWSRPGRPA